MMFLVRLKIKRIGLRWPVSMLLAQVPLIWLKKIKQIKTTSLGFYNITFLAGYYTEVIRRLLRPWDWMPAVFSANARICYTQRFHGSVCWSQKQFLCHVQGKCNHSLNLKSSSIASPKSWRGVFSWICSASRKLLGLWINLLNNVK